MKLSDKQLLAIILLFLVVGVLVIYFFNKGNSSSFGVLNGYYIYNNTGSPISITPYLAGQKNPIKYDIPRIIPAGGNIQKNDSYLYVIYNFTGKYLNNQLVYSQNVSITGRDARNEYLSSAPPAQNPTPDQNADLLKIKQWLSTNVFYNTTTYRNGSPPTITWTGNVIGITSLVYYKSYTDVYGRTSNNLLVNNTPLTLPYNVAIGTSTIFQYTIDMINNNYITPYNTSNPSKPIQKLTYTPSVY
jgi:hypothetical protein